MLSELIQKLNPNIKCESVDDCDSDCDGFDDCDGDYHFDNDIDDATQPPQLGPLCSRPWRPFLQPDPFQILGALVDDLVELADATIHLWTNQITNPMATFISTPNKYTQHKYNKSCFVSLSSVLALRILGLAQHDVTLKTDHT